MLLLLTITHAAREETINRSSTEMITKVIQMARKKWICCAALIIY